MYLKSIEIQGFKSFPDPTHLTFSDGITAVVGPNGSGKSNIADAIRWVLGEQSVRTLRGGRMEDVIFGGTRERSPMGFCQVELTVDNSDGAIPLEYAEVTVTRRYYRSGESEYFINRKAVRLRDVRELFMDTGLGEGGYSIIGQGRIDEILSVRSVERREIFEEAAGISKVRLRREESSRRLEKAEENLTRIRDIITELEGRVEPLRQQADKARQYLQYRDQLRQIEVGAAVDRLDRLEGLIKTARVDSDNAERMLAARRSELEQAYERSERCAAEIRQTDDALEQARAGLTALQSDAAAAEADAAVARTNLENARERLENARREAGARLERQQELEARLTVQRQGLERIQKETDGLEAQRQELLREIEAAGSQSRDTDRKIDGLRATLAEAAEATREKQAELLSARASAVENENLGERLFWQEKETRDRLERLGAELEQSEAAESAAAQKAQAAENARRGFELTVQVRRDKEKQAREEAGALERTCHAREDRLRMLQDMEREHEGFSFAVKKILQAGGQLRGIRGPLSSLIRAGDAYTAAVETALGAALQNVVTDDEASAKAAIGYLKANKLGRATFLPITAVKPRWTSRRALEGEPGFLGYADDLVSSDELYRGIVSALLGTTAVVDHIDNAIRMGKKYRYAFRIVTQDGQVIQSGGAMTGGSLAKSAGVLSRANEIDRLTQEVSGLRAELAGAQDRRKTAERELQAAEDQADTARAARQAAEEALHAAAAEHSARSARAGAAEEELTRLACQREEQARRQTEWETRIRQLEQETAERAAAQKSVSDELDGWLRTAAEDARHSSGLESRMSALRVRLGALQSEAGSTRQTMEMLDGLLQAARTEVTDKNAEIQAAAEAIESYRARIDRHTADRSAAGKKQTGMEAEIRRLNTARLELDGRKSRIEKEIQSKNNEILAQERLRLSLDHQLEQLENEEKSVLDRLWSEYELTPAAARGIYKTPVDPKRAEKRIGELRAAIRALGSVNLDAVAEFEEVNGRYQFLCGQKEDLEKARDDLREVIGRLTRGMEQAFSEKFRQISQAFEKTFEEIFGGGRAYLRLEEGKGLLECGIEISVELPGKGLRAISLLSGGEKAFVAIALYFAIIRVSPTPFCVLDEIDAALDDVNVRRFAGYMRGLCAHTQFIVITHRRGTMEGSDILYGATMQEHGVTKLLKLDLSEAEHRLHMQIR